MALSEICRTCLRNDHKMFSIFEAVQLECDAPQLTTIELLKQMPRLKITESTSLPTNVCTRCMEDIKRIYTFILQCEHSSAVLKRMQEMKVPLKSQRRRSEPSENRDPLRLKPPSDQSASKRMRKKMEEFSMHDAWLDEIQDDSTDINDEYMLNAIAEHQIKVELTEDFADAATGESTSDSIPSEIEAYVIIKSEPDVDLAMSDHLSENGVENNIENEVQGAENVNTTDSEDVALHFNVTKKSSRRAFRCQLCGKAFSTIASHDRHIVTCEPLLECDICLVAFQNKDSLTAHLEREHPNECMGHPGLIGRESYKNFYNLSDSENFFQALSEAFSPDDSSTDQLQLDDSTCLEKKYVCPQCPKEFINERRLKGHMRVHTFGFVCKKCKKTFRSNNHLKAHEMRIHGGEWKNIQCDVCTRFFACKADLVRHQLTHTKEKPYQCNMCTGKFGYKRFLQNHMLITHEVSEDYVQQFLKEKYGNTTFEQQLNSTFKCNVCSEEVDRAMLGAHVNSHKTENKKK